MCCSPIACKKKIELNHFSVSNQTLMSEYELLYSRIERKSFFSSSSFASFKLYKKCECIHTAILLFVWHVIFFFSPFHKNTCLYRVLWLMTSDVCWYIRSLSILIFHTYMSVSVSYIHRVIIHTFTPMWRIVKYPNSSLYIFSSLALSFEFFIFFFILLFFDNDYRFSDLRIDR